MNMLALRIQEFVDNFNSNNTDKTKLLNNYYYCDIGKVRGNIISISKQGVDMSFQDITPTSEEEVLKALNFKFSK